MLNPRSVWTWQPRHIAVVIFFRTVRHPQGRSLLVQPDCPRCPVLRRGQRHRRRRPQG